MQLTNGSQADFPPTVPEQYSSGTRTRAWRDRQTPVQRRRIVNGICARTGPRYGLPGQSRRDTQPCQQAGNRRYTDPPVAALCQPRFGLAMKHAGDDAPWPRDGTGSHASQGPAWPHARRWVGPVGHCGVARDASVGAQGTADRPRCALFVSHDIQAGQAHQSNRVEPAAPWAVIA